MTNSNNHLNQNLMGQRIDNGALELVSIIGIGAYGVVYKALARDGKYYAVKCLNKTGLDSRQRSFQRREIALHTLASSHPNIVTLHNVIENASCIYVVLSYCSDGDLFSQITEKSRYLGNDELIRSVFLQIVDAVEYCHRLGIYHRDLKPENILCDAQGSRVVLADFGLATAEKTSGDFGCGSTFYMSPECQGGLFQRLGSYSTLHNDVWSLGVILVNLTCGRNPWKQACPSDETFRAYLSNPDFLRSILPISKQCNELLKRIFALNPASRISIKELKAEVKRMTRWTMTLDELRYATRATKEAARAWAPAHILDDPSNPDAPPVKAPPQAQIQQYAQPKPKVVRDVFDAADDSTTVSSEDSVEQWKRHQQQEQILQQQHRRQQARQQYASPVIASPATSPAGSSACPEQMQARAKQQEIQQQQASLAAAGKATRSNFSLSDSDESSSDEDDDAMDYTRQPQPCSPTKPHQQQVPQLYTPPQRQSPNPNAYVTRSANKVAPPPPLGAQSPRTPRQLFVAAQSTRQRKQSIESTSSSSSSASSDASWTGLPPTPDTPIFTKRSAAELTQEKAKAHTFSIGNAKLKLAF